MKTLQKKVHHQLAQFHGTEQFFKIPLIKTRFTQGIKYLAESTDCYWLVTDASVVAKSLLNRSYFITVDFRKMEVKEKQSKGYDALIVYSDGNGNVLERQYYHATDFPLDSLRLFFVQNTLMLPSEY